MDLSRDLETEQNLTRRWLRVEEIARWNRISHERTSRHFAFTRAALRATLCERLGCQNKDLEFHFHGHAKPFAVVQGRVAPVSFNLSHGGDHGLIAVSDRGQLGVDVEVRTHDRNTRRLAGGVFGPNELRAFREAGEAERDALFYRLWTLKEALIKALGSGFSVGAQSFEVPSQMLEGATEGTFGFPHEAHEASARWRLVDLGEERFAAALAYDPTA